MKEIAKKEGWKKGFYTGVFFRGYAIISGGIVMSTVSSYTKSNIENTMKVSI